MRATAVLLWFFGALLGQPVFGQEIRERRLEFPGGSLRAAKTLAMEAIEAFEIDDARAVLTRQQHSPAGITNRYRLERAGLPSDEQLLVIRTTDGRAWSVTNAERGIQFDTAEIQSPLQSLAEVLDHLGLYADDETVKASVERIVSRRVDGQYRLYHSVVVRSSNETLEATMQFLVAARNGEVAQERSLRFEADGLGDVFDPNPVQTSGVVYSDDDDSNAAIPASQYFTRTLQGLDGSGFLTGPYASTAPTAYRTYQPGLVFQFQRADAAFEEVMAYYHIDEFQRYLQSLGFDDANNRQQELDVHGIPWDNSYYDTSDRRLYFGDGGVDDAEDADIILHEYGHSLHDDISGIGDLWSENGALSEGFGDYLAASRFQDALVGEWDATSYVMHDPPYLRRADGNKHYPEDKTGESHDDGEIWAAALWDLNQDLGAAAADTLILQSMFFQTPASGFQTAAATILLADQVLNGGANIPVIEGVFVSRGILEPTTSYANTTVELSARETKPQPGESFTLDLEAGLENAGGLYVLLPAPAIGSTVLPGTELHFDVTAQWTSFLGSVPGLIGNLDGSGTASVAFTLPPGAPVGARLYAQYVTIVGNQFNAMSNLVPLRVQGY
ncbi:MAG: M36 family metallopeptidase [Planctomycetota bacterium]